MDGGEEVLEVDGLGEVLEESGGVAGLNVVIGAVTAEGDGGDGVALGA